METDNGKRAGNKAARKRNAGKKGSKTKKAKVVMPKMNNITKPQAMTLEEWQVALRQQQAEKEPFDISMVDEEHCPGE